MRGASRFSSLTDVSFVSIVMLNTLLVENLPRFLLVSIEGQNKLSAPTGLAMFGSSNTIKEVSPPVYEENIPGECGAIVLYQIGNCSPLLCWNRSRARKNRPRMRYPRRVLPLSRLTYCGVYCRRGTYAVRRKGISTLSSPSTRTRSRASWNCS